MVVGLISVDGEIKCTLEINEWMVDFVGHHHHLIHVLCSPSQEYCHLNVLEMMDSSKATMLLAHLAEVVRVSTRNGKIKKNKYGVNGVPKKGETVICFTV